MGEAGFGRRVPATWRHVERYPLSAAPEPERFRRTPVVLGINWYSAFDRPEQDEHGRWWIGRGPFGTHVGGHAILADHGQLPDREPWYVFYNQGRQGACVGYSFSRALTQLHRALFDAVHLWNRAKATDEWGDTNPGDNNGTSLVAAAKILHGEGPVLWSRSAEASPSPHLGVGEYRWAESAGEVLAALELSAEFGGVPLLNSWGEDYPRVVWLALGALERLLAEDGEACVLSRR
jgi:hypothetical protein